MQLAFERTLRHGIQEKEKPPNVIIERVRKSRSDLVEARKLQLEAEEELIRQFDDLPMNKFAKYVESKKLPPKIEFQVLRYLALTP